VEAAEEEVCRVLVVEDDVFLQKSLVRSLERLGHEVEIARNGAEGLRRTLEWAPHVILTDIRMPELDGHTFLRRLAAHDIDGAIVVMSAHGDMADVVEVMRQGAIDYLSKPWTPSELAAALARATEINRKRRAARAREAAALAAARRVDAAGEALALPLVPPADTVFGAVLEQLKRGDVVLPALSPVVAELRAVVADPATSVDEVAAVIARDPRTSVQVLRLANSAQYARNGRSNDVATAVQRVGLSHIQGIAETLHAHACFAVREPALAALQERVWKHSVARAISMRALSELAQGEVALDANTAYCAGLFVDAGASFLIWLAGERAAGVRSPPPTAESFVAALQEQHTEVGSLLLQHWGMDESLVFIAAHHHDDAPPAPPHPYWAVSVLAAELADTLVGAEDLTRPEPLDGNLVDRCAAELGVGATLLSRVRSRLVPELAAILESVA
jgi:HD-like signal output (HDOD) protein/FixJ family two-component response regulator